MNWGAWLKTVDLVASDQVWNNCGRGITVHLRSSPAVKSEVQCYWTLTSHSLVTACMSFTSAGAPMDNQGYNTMLAAPQDWIIGREKPQLFQEIYVATRQNRITQITSQPWNMGYSCACST
jgi:hypothetical protein